MSREAALSKPVLATAVNDEAFERVYLATWQRVFRYAWVLTQDSDEAQDIAADTFERAYRSWGSGRPPKGDEIGWLFVVARRIAIDHRRRRRLLAWLPLASARTEHATDDALGQSETWLWFQQLSRLLPDRQRDALLLRYQFDLPDTTIAEVLGLSPGGVRTLVSRARATLRHAEESE